MLDDADFLERSAEKVHITINIDNGRMNKGDEKNEHLLICDKA